MTTMRSIRRWSLVALAAACVVAALPGCELLVDFDRSKIPQEGGVVGDDATMQDAPPGTDAPPGMDGPAMEASDDGTTPGDSSGDAPPPGDSGMDTAPGADVGGDSPAEATGGDTGAPAEAGSDGAAEAASDAGDDSG
jgi:hypothetical protein